MLIKQARQLAVTFTLTIAAITTPAQAALISQINGLDIGGTHYDVTFHADTSFKMLWDNDEDQIFGDSDGAVFATAPTFWGNQTGAATAAQAIMNYLGESHWTGDSVQDLFLVPYAVSVVSDTLAYVEYYNDGTGLLSTDVLSANDVATVNGVFANAPYVSFAVSSVPVPAAVWLFCSGLIGLIGVARRKQSV